MKTFGKIRIGSKTTLKIYLQEESVPAYTCVVYIFKKIVPYFSIDIFFTLYGIIFSIGPTKTSFGNVHHHRKKAIIPPSSIQPANHHPFRPNISSWALGSLGSTNTNSPAARKRRKGHHYPLPIFSTLFFFFSSFFPYRISYTFVS